MISRVMMMSLVLMTAGLGVMATASAEPNPCNGLFEDDCTCKFGTTYCAEGEKCARYVGGICVQGGRGAEVPA
jgi:hypothetical protein